MFGPAYFTEELRGTVSARSRRVPVALYLGSSYLRLRGGPGGCEMWLAGLVIAALGSWIALHESRRRLAAGLHGLIGGGEALGYVLIFGGVGLTIAAVT